MKLKFVNKLPKKMKRFNVITGIVDAGLITSTVMEEYLLQHLPVVLGCPLVLP